MSKHAKPSEIKWVHQALSRNDVDYSMGLYDFSKATKWLINANHQGGLEVVSLTEMIQEF